MVPVTRTFSLRESAPPVLAQIRRLATNVALAHLWGGQFLLVGLVTADLLDPQIGGPGTLGNWAWGMAWLLFASPLVLLVLAIVDLALYRTDRQRRAGLFVSLAPGVLVGLITVLEPASFSIAAWLAATGLAFGLTMRLPPPPARERDLVGPNA